MDLTEKNFNKNYFWVNLFKSPAAKDDFTLLIKSMPPFAALEDKHIKYLMKLIHNRVYSAEENIFCQGDPAIGFYIIRNGVVNVKHKDIDGNIYEMAKFERGDFFGEIALLSNDIRSASAIAVTEVNASVIFKPDLDEFINKYPSIGVNILNGIAKVVATRLRKLDQDYISLYHKFKKLSEEVEK